MILVEKFRLHNNQEEEDEKNLFVILEIIHDDCPKDYLLIQRKKTEDSFFCKVFWESLLRVINL